MSFPKGLELEKKIKNKGGGNICAPRAQHGRVTNNYLPLEFTNHMSSYENTLAGSLNQNSATALSEPILKAAHHRAYHLLSWHS